VSGIVACLMGSSYMDESSPA